MSERLERRDAQGATAITAGTRPPATPLAAEPAALKAPHGGWVYGALVGDHARIDELLTRLADAVRTDDAAAIDPVWTDLERLLDRHIDTEDSHLVPLLETRAPEHAAAVAAEHTAIRAWMAQLGLDIELHRCRAQVVQDFAQLLREHADGEEALLYRVADAEAARPERHGLREGLRAIFNLGPERAREEPE